MRNWKKRFHACGTEDFKEGSSSRIRTGQRKHHFQALDLLLEDVAGPSDAGSKELAHGLLSLRCS